jgi:hypothetical protein
MITTSQMYWITRLDGIVTLLALLASFLFVMGVIMLVYGRNECFAVKIWSWDTDKSIADRHKFGRKLYKAGLMMAPVGILLYILLVMVPTTKQMAAIFIVPRIANSEKVQQAGNRLYDLAVDWMDELKPNKNNKEGTGK